MRTVPHPAVRPGCFYCAAFVLVSGASWGKWVSELGRGTYVAMVPISSAGPPGRLCVSGGVSVRQPQDEQSKGGKVMKNSIIRMSLVIAVVALSVAVFSTPASAQFYFGIKGSAFLPNTSEEGLKDFDTGYGAETFAGYRFMPYFGLEGGAGYYQTKWSDSNFEGTGIKMEDKISAIPLTLTRPVLRNVRA